MLLEITRICSLGLINTACPLFQTLNPNWWQRGCLGEKKEQKCLQIWVGWDRLVPFSHHWLEHWAERGSSVGMEKNLVLQGRGFRDLQGKLGVNLERIRTHSWAMITWLPLNFISHFPLYSKMLPKETFLVVVLCTPRPGLQWPLQPAPAKGGCRGPPLFGVSATAGEPSGQVPAGSARHSSERV